MFSFPNILIIPNLFTVDPNGEALNCASQLHKTVILIMIVIIIISIDMLQHIPKSLCLITFISHYKSFLVTKHYLGFSLHIINCRNNILLIHQLCEI